jgi:DNA-3-methyladenine glycosylase
VSAAPAQELPGARLGPGFYARDARIVARALIGAHLVCGDRVGRIVETEAYRGPSDGACHARAGLTRRTATLFGPPGRAYVFLVYGMHDCFNVVCLAEGAGHAVLVRGLEPVAGLGREARTDGPGRLTRALGITRADDAVDLVSSARLWLAPRARRPRINASARVGVAYAGAIAEAKWRFFDPTSEHVSRPPLRSIGLGAPGPG